MCYFPFSPSIKLLSLEFVRLDVSTIKTKSDY